MFCIGNHSVGLGARPFIVAEMSGNHIPSLDRALAMIEAAAQADLFPNREKLTWQ